jgi:hypothetical protein
MIDFALKRNRVKRYRHAARHLGECTSLASAIGDFRDFEPHEGYVNPKLAPASSNVCLAVLITTAKRITDNRGLSTSSADIDDESGSLSL